MSDIKDEQAQDVIGDDTAEILGTDDLDDVHGGVSISRTADRIQRVTQTIRPTRMTVNVREDDLCCTVYGGTGDVINPLKR